jgi:hypothetical protein
MGAVFGDEVLATAILDRLLHHSHTILITLLTASIRALVGRHLLPRMG